MKSILPKFIFICLFFSCLSSLVGQPIEFEHANLSFYRDTEGKKQRIQSKLDWEKRRQQILLGFQKAIGPFPADRSKKHSLKRISKSKLGNVVVETFQISVDDKSHVVVDLYLPKSAFEPDAKLPAILALHPTGAPGKRIIGGNSPRKNRQYANELAQRGYVVIAPDYPSFGDLKSHDFQKDGRQSGTLQGILNHMRCIDYLETLPYVDSNKIGVVGHSLGGHNAIFTAVFDSRIKAIVTSCGWTPFHDYYQGKIAGWTSDRYMPRLKTQFKLDPDQVPFDFYELIAALAPRPFFTNSPLLDSNFEVKGVQKAMPKIEQIYSLFGSKKSLNAVYPKCQHDFPSEIREESYRFLDSVFGHRAKNDVGFGGELPRIKPLETDEALKAFSSSTISLVASEPVVHDPIAMSFDENRRMFVIEMKDYSEQDKDFLGRVRLLVDKDQDGVYERSSVFADKLSWPTAIICYDGGVFVGAAPDIWFLKDTTGNGRADIRKKVFTGFGRTNVQGLMNCFRWGLDNRIHGATSSSGGLVYAIGKDPKTAVQLRGRDFSFDPATLELRAETGGAQHGMCFDDWGNKFVCSNSDHAQTILFDDRYVSRNPYFRGQRARKSIAADGGQAPVFRTSPVEPWRVVRTRLRVAGRVPGPVEGGGTAAGYFTGSTGITIYRGDSNSVAKGTAIIGDVGSNIVHRKTIDRKGLDIVATRIDEKSELLTSTDNWFRPVQFGNAPDGCLYILDMYREVIEHPKSLPRSIKQHLDLTFGRDRGRIYRLGQPKLKRQNEIHSGRTSTELVEFLNHPNAWHRETAARLIFEKQDITTVPALQTVRVREFDAIGRIHALYALDGLKRLKLDDLVVASQDSHPQVRRHAILLAERHGPAWLIEGAIKGLVNDPDIQVRLQMAFSIGVLNPSDRIPLAWRLLRKSNGHPLMTTAIMSSANGIQDDLLERLMNNATLLESPVGSQSLALLVDQIAKRNKKIELERVVSIVQNLAASEQANSANRLALILCRANPKLIAQLMSQAELKTYLDAQLVSSQSIASDAKQNELDRIRSIEFLRIGTHQQVTPVLLSLVSIDLPTAIQKKAIEVLGEIGSDKIATALFEKRKRVGREAADSITNLILSKNAWVKSILKIAGPNDFSMAQLQILAKSNDAEITKMAKKRLNESSLVSKTQLLKQYESSLTLLGNPTLGKQVFEKNCSKCHKAGGIGFEIGPNLAAMKTRGKTSILTNVLDPNREVNPAYVNYLVQTLNGQSLTGMIAEETGSNLTLKQEKNKLVTLDKSNIEAIKNTGLSLMPVGLEKEISVEQMADLLEFLMTAN